MSARQSKAKTKAKAKPAATASHKLGRVDLRATAALARAGSALAVLDAVARQALAGVKAPPRAKPRKA